jgi:hypothetical protein
MSQELEGTWTVETSGGLTSCLFPVQHKVVIQPSLAEVGMLEVVLIDAGRQLLMGLVSPNGEGLVTLRLTVRVLDPSANLLSLRTTTDDDSKAREESPVGSWTAEEGGNVDT